MRRYQEGDCCWSYQSGADAAAVFESVQAVCVASLHKERTILPPTQPTSATIVTHWGLLENIFCSILNPGIYAWALSAWSVCHLSPIRGYLLHLTHLCLCSESGAFTQCLKGACALIECEIYFVFLSNSFCFVFIFCMKPQKGYIFTIFTQNLVIKISRKSCEVWRWCTPAQFFFLFYKLDLTCDQILCCLFILIIRVLLYFKPTRLTRHKYLICDYAHFLTARYFPVLRLLTHCCFWAFSTHWIQHSLIWGESCLAVV